MSVRGAALALLLVAASACGTETGTGDLGTRSGPRSPEPAKPARDTGTGTVAPVGSPSGSAPAPRAVPPPPVPTPVDERAALEARFARLVNRELAVDTTRLPFFFTVAFDGSQRFGGWLEALDLARSAGRVAGRPAHFTFFVNTCYFDTAKVPSTIGRARSRDEVLVRRALAQIAVNEGHEIASHGVGHHDGASWDRARWEAELDAFHRVADTLVFEPVRDEAGRAVVPRFSPLAGVAPGEAGAACTADADCHQGRCADLGDAGRLCAPPCNLKTPCPEGLVCGAPMFRDDHDLCLPRPDPVAPGVKLRPRRVVGFRAPYLGASDAMIEALAARGYRYDTSLAAAPRWPRDVAVSRGGPFLLELGLAAWPGMRAVPMDYNYLQLKVTGERMTADYRSGLVQAYAAGRVPFNVGHHFATWEGGAYRRALEDAVGFAAAGCPDEAGAARCPGAVLASFREVADAIDAARTRPAGAPSVLEAPRPGPSAFHQRTTSR